MHQVRNSQLLDTLLKNAEEPDIGNAGALTAERFLIALCDYILSDVSPEEIETQDALCEAVLTDIPDIADFRDYLTGFVSNREPVALADKTYIRNKLFEFRFIPSDDNVTEITPEMLFAGILRDPTKAISDYFEDPNRRAADVPEGNRADPGTYQSDEENDLPGTGTDLSALSDLTDKARKIRNTLSESVFGQNHAVNMFVSGYFQSELLSMTDKKHVRPKSTFLFAGPPGVGKTFLAQKAAEVLEMPFRCFDMSEYSDDESVFEFSGSDKLYTHGAAGNVTSFVAKNPRCILLFDEIEKAHLKIIHLFLQILDGGRLRDSFTDHEVSFADTIIIFTTNAGKRLYEQSDTADLSLLSGKVILNALAKETAPDTGSPFFPAAICSRFASGNVIMFNHLGAYYLREIAKKEFLRHKKNFERELRIRIDTDERIFTALLFAAGGRSDARTIRSRAEKFFYSELFELLRLLKTSGKDDPIRQLKSIRFTLEPSVTNPETADLFRMSGKPNAAAVMRKADFAVFSENNAAANLILCQDRAAVDQALRQNDIQVVILDLNFGRRSQPDEFMNAEDSDSRGRDLLRYIRSDYPDVPVYILEKRTGEYNDEELVSFLNAGARGIIDDYPDKKQTDTLIDICDALYQQKCAGDLAKAHKLLSFETAQICPDEGGSAEIRIFDLSLKTSINAEDADDILSSLSKPNVSFSQVIGAEDAKEELRYFVDYLKDPKKYIGTGLKAPRGVILYGPPGTGKTMLAKAMASESDVTFITAEGNEFLKTYVGEGKDRVHELFRTARRYAPAILFVDEIDAIAKERTGGIHAASNGEDVLTAFLAEMDGFKSDPSKPVFVLAATNFDVNPGSDRSLDAALMRRFDRKIYVGLPTKEERIRYLKMKIKANPAFEVSDDATETLAVLSTGSSLAELENVLETALREAVRTGTLKVDDKILTNAFETYKSGEEKKWDADQLKRVARHEAGHTFICRESGEKPSYVTVVSRGDHGGYMFHGDHEGKMIYTKKELLARIRTALGGRAAEIVYYGEEDGLSTGAGGDLMTATEIAKQIVCVYGMDAGQGLAADSPQELAAGGMSCEARQAVNDLLWTEMKNAIRIISENKDNVDRLADELIRKNHLTAKEIEAVFAVDNGQ